MVRLGLVGLVAALIGVATVLALAGWGGGSSRPVALASLDASPSHTLQTVYDADESRGMKILQAMQGKTESPLLAKLFKSKRMRGVLAAAIGSARSQEGSDGGNLAFELGNIVSGQATAKHLAAAPRAAPRAAPHHIQQMRQRHAAAIPRAALPKPPAPAPVKKYVRDEGGSFDYDAFAPGVLPGTAAFKPKETAAQKATDAARAKELAGVEIATGFSDKAVASDMREDKLEAQVKALKKAGAAQKALLTGEVTAERAKEVARAKQAADKAAMLAKVKAKAVEAKAKARKVLENSPAAKAARAKAREEKEEVAVKAAQQVRPNPNTCTLKS